MSQNRFGECHLGPSAIQLRHEQKIIDIENRNGIYLPTPELSAKILPIWNKILMSLIAYNSQGNMVVWFDFI